jgi:hypothetical protein
VSVVEVSVVEVSVVEVSVVEVSVVDRHTLLGLWLSMPRYIGVSDGEK